MSMSELTDDQLDGLFRKSAEEFDPPYDPAAWQDMKTRLDAHDQTMPGRNTDLEKSASVGTAYPAAVSNN